MPEASTPVGHPAPHRHRVALAALLFGLIAAPLAWQVQVLASSAISVHDWRTALFTIAGVCIATALAGGAVAFVSWRRTFAEFPGSAHHLLDRGQGRARFMAMCGILVSLLFLYALLFGLTVVFLVPATPV